MLWTQTIYCGARMFVPIMPDGLPLHLPFDDWDWPETYCGPGKTIGDWLVKDNFPGGTHAHCPCYIHDHGVGLCKTRADHKQNDRMFGRNLIEAVFAQHPWSEDGRSEHTDLLWALTYYCSVDGIKT